MLTKTYIKAINWAQAKGEDEKGEMASWMILGAARASIALLLEDIIKPIMEGLASKVGG